MKKLSAAAFSNAKHFIYHHARPLERAIFQTHFENGPASSIWQELAHFQNADGGFGQSLEPDLRTPDSYNLATAIGLHFLVESGCSADHPMLTKALTYLTATLDPTTRTWRPTASQTHQHPHAPWWHDENGSLADTFDAFVIIPRALILSSFWHYSQYHEFPDLDNITQEVLNVIKKQETFGSGGGSDIEYTIHLAQANNLPQKYREPLRSLILRSIPQVVERDPERWHTYCITPLRLAPTPDTLGSNLIIDLIHQHLAYQIDHQAADGAWDPTWDWGGHYPQDWQIAKQEWRGHLTLKTLLSLKAYGCIN